MSENNRLIGWLLGAAFAVRLAVLFVYGPGLSLHSDDEGYVRSAIRLLEAGILTYHSPDEPTVHIMPGQPFLLASVFFLFGSGSAGMYAAKLAMIGIGVAGIYGLYLIGRFLGGPGAGLLAAGIFAFSAPHILTDNLLLTEAPFTTCLIFLLYFSVKLANDRRAANFYGVVLCYAACLMFRPTIAFYPLLLLGYLLLKKYPVNLLLKQTAIAAAILLAVLVPWWVRNFHHYHEFIPLTGGSGNPLLLGTYQGEGYPGDEPLEILLERLQYPSGDAYTMMKVQEKTARERMKIWWINSPRSFLRSYFYLKPVILWEKSFYDIELFRIKADRLNQIQPLLVKAGMIGILISMVFCSRHRTELFLVAGLLLYFTLLYSLYFVYSRYNLPLMPFIFLGISVGLHSVFRLFSRSLRGKTPA